jgi:hypothetical protein
MKLIKSLFLSTLLFTVIVTTGCEQGPTSSIESANTGIHLSKFSLPPGTTLTSATLHIYIDQANNDIVDIYAISSTWQENTVTWATKPTVHSPAEAFFLTDAVGWKTVSITGIAAKWFDGTYTNFGLLLDQRGPDNSGYALYDSRRGINKPYLEVVYTGGSANLPDSADAYIWEYLPNYTGNSVNLWTGYASGYEKQSLLAFSIEPTPPEISCETAYAKGPNATCFLDIPNKQGNNWGWTNYIAGAFTGTQSWPIYAGAGQCDVSKGTQVGTLDVTYNGTTVTVFYNINSGFTLDETHLWIGSGMLPVKKGKYVSNPGGFNYNGQNPVSVNIAAPFYIAAHSVVCGNY